MESALTCPVCAFHYNAQDRRPKSLKCGHSLCLKCLQAILHHQGRLICPIDQDIIWEKLEDVSDNQAIKDILQAQEVRCPLHREVMVEGFCLGHMCVVCERCGHRQTAGCEVKDLLDDLQEITTVVFKEIDRLNKDLPAEIVPPDFKQAIDKRFREKIEGNIQLLVKLKAVERTVLAPRCTTCQLPADSFLELSTFKAYCKRCVSQNPDNPEQISLSEKPPAELVKLLAARIPFLLKKVNFCQLSLENFLSIDKRARLDIKSLHELGQYLLSLETSKATFADLPGTFYCPKCKQPQSKATCQMAVLPCVFLHAVCLQCAAEFGNMIVECPLDGMQFNINPQQLERLGLPVSQEHSQEMPELSAMWISMARPTPQMLPYEIQQPAKDMRGPPQWPYPGSPKYQPGEMLPSHFVSPPQTHFQQPVPIPNPPPPVPNLSSAYIEGLPLPQFPLPDNLRHLIRFPSVLPVPNLPNGNNNNKGWCINFAKNHVDAVTMTVFDTCKLVGLGLANPVNPTDVAMVESVSLYSGRRAAGNSMAVHQGYELLQGGNQLITYFYLQTPFVIPAFNPVTLKVKIVSAPSNPSTGVIFYRGSPYQRPDTWCGSDGLTWDFEDTPEAGAGETVNGQNNLSGPILAFVYQH